VGTSAIRPAQSWSDRSLLMHRANRPDFASDSVLDRTAGVQRCRASGTLQPAVSAPQISCLRNSTSRPCRRSGGSSRLRSCGPLRFPRGGNSFNPVCWRRRRIPCRDDRPANPSRGRLSARLVPSIPIPFRPDYAISGIPRLWPVAPRANGPLTGAILLLLFLDLMIPACRVEHSSVCRSQR
jgi:hypothetical protein